MRPPHVCLGLALTVVVMSISSCCAPFFLSPVKAEAAIAWAAKSDPDKQRPSEAESGSGASRASHTGASASATGNSWVRGGGGV